MITPFERLQKLTLGSAATAGIPASQRPATLQALDADGMVRLAFISPILL